MRTKTFSGKIITVLLAVMLFLSTVVFQLPFVRANADEVSDVKVTSYFKTGETVYSKHGDIPVLRLVAVASESVTTKFQRKLSVSDMGLSFFMAEELSSVNFAFTTNRYFELSSSSTADTNVKVVKDGANLKLLVDGEAAASTVAYNKDTAINLSIKVNDAHYIEAAFVDVDGNVIGTAGASKAMVEDFDQTIADLAVTLTYKDGSDYENTTGVEFVYIDQKASDTSKKYRQTFALDANNNVTDAEPIVDLKDTFANFNSDGDIVLAVDKEYTVSYTAYSVRTTPATKIEVDDTVADANVSNKRVIFNAVGDTTLKVTHNDVVVAEYDVNVVNPDASYGNEALAKVNAPKYDVSNVDAISAFKDALDKATKKEYTVTNDAGEEETITASIRLGSGQYLTIPSLKDLVSDNLTPYSNLDYTVYWAKKDTSTSFSSTSSYRVPVAEAGTYVFFVAFEDEFGNAMSSDLFYKDNDGVFTTEGCDYANFVFEFTVNDDAPRSVEGAEQQTWYKGVKNTAVKFTISAASYDTEYSLYYKNGETWVEVLAYDEDKDEGYYTDYYAENANGVFTDEDIIAIAYDGSLTFTPVKTGEYKIVCNVFEKNNANRLEGETYISVNEVKVVKPAVQPELTWIENLFTNNLGSAIFLIIGTLALIGLVVVLFIKPKEAE
ncbi:MAG: hypothetical protein J6B16_00455 [Clostridia bacterium]|nr:hypothetical protein [Clostridia bacterium]